MIKLLNKVTAAPNVRRLGGLGNGETFLFQGELAVMVDDDPKFMILGGNHSGEVIDIDDDDDASEEMEVTMVDIEITWRHKTTPTARKKKR